MGTRGLLGFRQRGQRKATYNHWDSHPAGLGASIVAFVQRLSDEDIRQMLARVAEITWVKEMEPVPEELQQQYIAAGFFDASVNNGSASRWYCLLRHTQGGECLKYIHNGTLHHLIEGTDFLENTLMCEWAYFIDFEQKVVEVHKPGKWIKEMKFSDLSEELSSERLLRTEEDEIVSD